VARIASVAQRSPRAAGLVVAVESVGHLVPCSPWSGRVHSVFARACNIACGELLLTIGARGTGNGPTTIVLADGAGDLRDRFAVAEDVHARGGSIRGVRTELVFANARVWRAQARAALCAGATIKARLHALRQRLERTRAARPNVLDRDAAPIARAIGRACSALDLARATANADRLLGWGEGLTPAGDDFLVGLLAGLDALGRGDPQRERFRDSLAAAVAARTHATTPIAAHALRLAAAGHRAASLDRFVVALCCGDDEREADPALESLLAVGATSGADTASGVLVAVDAWSHAALLVEAA